MIVRTSEEKKILREGGRRLAGLLQAVASMVAPGVSSHALEDFARAYILEHGDVAAFLGYTPEGAHRPYPAALCVSVNDAIVHGIPNETPHLFADGDIVTLDAGLVHQGLITDAAVTVIVGNHPELAKLLSAAKEALAAGIGQARAGKHMGDIGAAIEKVAVRYGYHFPKELGGHSVGRHVHEEPFVPNYGMPGAGPELLSGMVLAIEPMLMLGKPAIKLDRDGYTYRTKDGSKAVHVEHTILITDGEPETLTKA